MERVYESGAVAGAPAAPAVPSTGYPTAGNPGLGIDATKPGPYWFHMLIEELRAVIVAAGIVPDHTALNQLLLALQGGFGLAKSLGSSGYITLPGGVLLQWAVGTSSAAGGTNITYPVAFSAIPKNAFLLGSNSGPRIATTEPAANQLTGIVLHTWDGAGARVSVAYHMIAIGY